jgi:argininosuccinate lyase
VKHTVQRLYESGKTSEDILVEELNKASMQVLGKPLVGIANDNLLEILDPVNDVSRRDSFGGPAPNEVAQHLSMLKRNLEDDVSEHDNKTGKINTANAKLQERISEIIGREDD